MRISDWSSDVCASDLPATIQRSSIRELIGVLAIPARAALVMAPAAPPRRSANPSLFRAMKSRPPRPRPFHAPIRNNVLPVAYSALATPAPLLEQVGVYSDRHMVGVGRGGEARV